MTTCSLPAGDPRKITTYDLIEPYVAPATANGKLLVFLPGSLAQACQYQQILGEAAAVGYYAVGVSYPNGAKIPATKGTCPLYDQIGQKTLTEICKNNIGQSTGSFDCYEQVRHNRFDGTPEANGAKADSTGACPSCNASNCFCDPDQIARTPYPDGGTPTEYVAAEGIDAPLEHTLHDMIVSPLAPDP